MRHILIKSLLMASVACGMSSAHADHLLVCPSAATVSTYNFEFSLPYAYHQQTKTVNFIVAALDKNPDEEVPHSGLVLYPVPVSFTDDPAVKTREVLSQLTLETPTPVTYRLGDGGQTPMCIYAIPGNNHFTAFLFADDFEDTDSSNTGIKAKKSQKPKNRHEQAMNLIKKIGPSVAY